MELFQEILCHVFALADSECLQQIEEIVCAFEVLGSDGGSRHDFG